jgi:hypothetical protein
MEKKTINIKPGRVVEMDEQGRYRLIEAEFGLNEAISEAEVIDLLERHNKADLRKHFPMYGFHDAEPIDRTPEHKEDY